MLNKKIDYSLNLINEQINKHRNPVVMTSFGKDSMVLMDLVRKVDKNLPYLFHREALKPKKYRFSNEVIEKWDLTVYDFPPVQSAVQYTRLPDGTLEFEIQNWYSFGNYTYTVPTGIIESDSDDCCCGLQILTKPKGQHEFIWDLVFIGHKSSDTDVFYESLELKTDVKNDIKDAPVTVFPLKDWTDEDIWEYSRQYNVPQNMERYGQKEFRNQSSDFTYNPDYFETCIKCINKFEMG